jgi:hypothetical protein
MKLRILIVALIFPFSSLFSQGLITDALENPLLKAQFNDSAYQNHSSIRDLYFFLPDSVSTPSWASARHPYRQWLVSKVFHENAIIIKRPGFFITADPLFDAELGKVNPAGKNTWVNTRGVQAYGKIFSPAFEFYSSYYESQAMLPPYLDSISSRVGGVPGQGFFRRADGTIDHGYATGWMRFTPNKHFAFEAGTGRNFFGNGYRSMLLSDNARNTPYFRIDSRLWRFRYVNLWTEMQDNRFIDIQGAAYQKKYGAFHYLSYAVTKTLELSFFEAVIWQGRDSTHTRGFDVNYLNPVILYRPVEWTLGSPDNALMGINLSWKPLNNTTLYGQFLIDEWSVKHIKARDGWYANKYAGQAGAKSLIPLSPATAQPSLSPRHLFVQTELNFSRPYVYSHYNVKQSYSHFSQPLAHPLGANFVEWMNFAHLRWDRFILEGRYSHARFGANVNNLNYGHNILTPYTTYVTELDNFIGQGQENKLTYKTVTIAWLINPASLLNVFVSLADRHQITDIQDKHELWFTFGIRNSIRNLYYDF